MQTLGPDAAPLVLFDGVCNMCNGVVNFIIDHDPGARLRFASLQSSAARAAVARSGGAPGVVAGDADPETILLVEGGRVFERSTAALRIARYLPWPYRAIYVLVIVPRPLRDVVYSWIARNRYRWFGKSDACRVPTPELRARFVE
jgi:predicted DCC family thiol-disulfide oxidoreductase YuxK